jgi:hypothetical protein
VIENRETGPIIYTGNSNSRIIVWATNLVSSEVIINGYASAYLGIVKQKSESQIKLICSLDVADLEA